MQAAIDREPVTNFDSYSVEPPSSNVKVKFNFLGPIKIFYFVHIFILNILTNANKI